VSRSACSITSTGTSICTPSASRTSALPLNEVNDRLPCLAMRTPAPAASSAAAVEMLNVTSAPPPVPHVSTSSSGRSAQDDHDSASRDDGGNLLGVSPRTRADQQCAICAAVASPAMTRSMRASRPKSPRHGRGGEWPSSAVPPSADAGHLAGRSGSRARRRRRDDETEQRTRSMSSSPNTPYIARFVRFTTPTRSS
jgi:hypothetical protein